MITGASRKPLSALRSPVVPLNENVAPRRDQRVVDECATSCTLWIRFGVTAVDRRRSVPTSAGDAHRLRVRRRALRLRAGDGERRRRGSRSDSRSGEDRAAAPRHVELEPGLRGHDADAVARHGEARVLRRACRRCLSSRAKYASAPPAAGRRTASAARASREPPARHPQRVVRRRTSLTGAETATRCLCAAPGQRLDRGPSAGSTVTGSDTGAASRTTRAHGTIIVRGGARSSVRPVAPAAIVMCRPRRTSARLAGGAVDRLSRSAASS